MKVKGTKEEGGKGIADKKGRRLVNGWLAGWMDSSTRRHIQIVTLLTNRIMKKNNLITVLKLWLITALGLGGWANADRLQGNWLAVQSLFPPVPLDSLCCFEGYGVEITMFEATQVDVCDTPLALLYQPLLAWACWREEKLTWSKTWDSFLLFSFFFRCLYIQHFCLIIKKAH